LAVLSIVNLSNTGDSKYHGHTSKAMIEQ